MFALCVWMCVCVCMRVFMYGYSSKKCERQDMFALCVWVYLCVYVCMYLCMDIPPISERQDTQACVCVCLYVCMHIHTYIRTNQVLPMVRDPRPNAHLSRVPNQRNVLPNRDHRRRPSTSHPDESRRVGVHVDGSAALHERCPGRDILQPGRDILGPGRDHDQRPVWK